MQQTVKAQLHSDFAASSQNGCAPVFIQFTDKTTGNPDSWKWDLGNGTISFLQNPATTYFNPGKYTIKLVTKKGAVSDTIVRQQYIVINALPKAAFKASDTTGCYPLKVNFTDESNAQEGNIIKWEWDMGDGTVSNLKNPSHIYTGSGNYNVILRITNTAGCVNTISKPQYIKIVNGVNADFSFSGSSQCTPPVSIHFINKSNGTGTLSYQWFFGDGNTSALDNPSNVYNNAGLYTIRLIAKNNVGCVDTLTKKDSVTVGAAHAGFTAPDSICQSIPFQVFGTSSPANAQLFWHFGDTTSTLSNPVMAFKNAGIYNISLVADFGSCKDSISKPIKILPKVIAAFSADKTISCSAPFVVKFTSSNTGATGYKWLFGDNSTSALQNPIHSFSDKGKYDVTLITFNANGCSDTLVQPAFINVSPAEMDITNLPVKGCAPLSFTPIYTVKSVLPVQSYLWDFGDGTTSTADIPTHIYNTPGIYSVKVTYTTTDGCTASINFPNAVNAGVKPTLSFSATPNIACASTPISFTDNSGNTITNWLWNFGDGIIDTSRNPIHYYNDTGYFSIKLIAGNNGCNDTLLKKNYMYVKPPVAKFTADMQCSDPYRFVFTNYSVAANSLTWDFGDGTTSTALNPIHIYSVKGSHFVKLTAVNGACTNIANYTARTIVEKADFKASDTVVCKGDSITLSPFGFDASNIIAYNWVTDFGKDTARTIKVAYNKSGKYTVALIITNLVGCTDTLVKRDYITVNGPTANFNDPINAACLKTSGTIQFTDASATDGTHAINKWQLNFGDGTAQNYNAPPFTHTYTAAGFYTVALKVTDTEGCADSISKSNQVFIGNPKANFSSPDSLSCQNKPVSFVNQSAGESLKYLWGFGDAGAGSADRDPLHNYSTLGSFNIWLKVTDAYGCTDSVFKPLYVKVDEPKAIFKVSDSLSSCPPLVVTFTNQSKYYKASAWDFGDGTSALVDNPVHFYNYPGIYYARLVATSPGGCTDTVYKKIEIKGPTGTFSYDKTSSCNPGTVSFTAQTQNTVSLIWDFNDGGALNTTVSSASHSYTAMGVYIPRMILEDDRGCKVPIQGKDTIRIYDVAAFFSFDKTLLCDQGIINFTDSSISNDVVNEFQWTMGDGTILTDRAPSHTYTATGIYPVKLSVKTLNGCTAISTQVTNIKVVSSPKVSMRGDLSACVPATIRFSGVIDVPDTSALVWKWDFSNNRQSNDQQPSMVSYANEGTFNTTLLVTNSSGCQTTEIKPVVIHPLPLVDAGNNKAICEKTNTPLAATGADKYTWTTAPGLSCNNCASPVASPDSSTIYRVTGESIFGCKSIDSVIITVKHPFRMQVITGDTLCKGESFHLLAKNAELYDWTPSIGLDNNHSETPVARPVQTTDL